MFIDQLLELEETWPAWLLWSIGIFFVTGPFFFYGFVDVLVFRRNPKTRVGIWLKKHEEQVILFGIGWPIGWSLLFYFDSFMVDPQGTGSSMLQLIATTAGIAIVVAIFNAIFRRK